MSYEVINGDCLEQMPKLLERGVTVDAIVTDPPYNAINRETKGLRQIDKGEADTLPVDIPLLAGLFARLSHGSIYVWCSDDQFSPWTLAFKGIGLTTRICSWLKSNPSPMNGERLWLSATELCVFARKPNATFNRHCARPSWEGPTELSGLHPCEKPVWLMREIVTASTNPGDTILDPFAGSFTTGVAALAEGRNFIGIEQSEDYCRVGEARLKRASGEWAEIPKVNRRQIDTPLFGA